MINFKLFRYKKKINMVIFDSKLAKVFNIFTTLIVNIICHSNIVYNLYTYVSCVSLYGKNMLQCEGVLVLIRCVSS